jgi:hypothetical protein
MLPSEEYSELFAIGRKLSKDPYCDIYGHINNLGKTNSLEVQTLLTVFRSIFERQQAVYLSKLYSKMKPTTLKNYIGRYIS